MWGDAVFVTSAVSSRSDATFRRGLFGDGDASNDRSRHQWKVYRLDRQTGRVVWERVAYEGVPVEKRHVKSTYASASPATDGRYVVAFFGSQGLYAYDMQAFVFKSPVTKLADFGGKRIRVLASEGEQSSIAALGGSAVPMSLPEVLPALQQGTIDGVNSVLGVFVTFRYYDAAPNLLDTSLWPILSVALVSKVWLDRLPADLRKAVVETGPKFEPELDKWQQARIANDTKAWTDNGGKIVKLSPEDQQETVRRVSGAAQSLVAKSAPLKELYEKLKAVTASVN